MSSNATAADGPHPQPHAVKLPIPPVVSVNDSLLTLPVVRPGSISTSAQRPISMTGHSGSISLSLGPFSGGGTWAGQLVGDGATRALPSYLTVPPGHLNTYLQFTFHAPPLPTSGQATATFSWEREDGSQDGDEFKMQASWSPTAPTHAGAVAESTEEGEQHHHPHHPHPQQ